MRGRLLWWAAAALLLLADAAGVPLAPPLPAGTLRADFGISIGTAIVSLLGGLFGLFGGGISRELKRALEGLRDVILQVGRKLVDYIFSAGRFLWRLFALLGRFWRSVLVPLFRWLRARLFQLIQFLRRVFGPVLRIIARIRDEFLRIYDRFIRPILEAIALARQILSIFVFLGLGWARKLDQKIAVVEDKIRRAVLDILGHLNRLSDIINRIVTLDFLLHRLLLLQSLFRYRGAWIGQWWAAQTRLLTDKERERIGTPFESIPFEQHLQEVTDAIQFNSGPVAPKAREFATDVRLLLAGLRGLA